ncbi:MAG TPA: aminoacyl-tRNA hydrolase [Fulvivirga sp.]|nr:aminoacyl-tRNA hydrolase [Fulvivirga sp.]
MKYLIIGLGNIGNEYELTRHNIGFLVLDKLADDHGASFTTSRYADVSKIKYKGRQLHLIKPSTYMNLSGKAVSYWMKELKIPKENILVIVDDIALPLGSLRMRAKGSAAGHNGLKNIEALTGGPDYPRLKFGIGNDFGQDQQVDYVLSNFTSDEFKILPEKIDKAINMILSFSTAGIARTMTEFND